MKLKVTRKILDHIHSGALETAEYERVPGFGLMIPKHAEGIDSKILNPINTWDNKEEFNETSKKLAAKFVQNFKKYEDGTPAEVIRDGGPNIEEF